MAVNLRENYSGLRIARNFLDKKRNQQTEIVGGVNVPIAHTLDYKV